MNWLFVAEIILIRCKLIGFLITHFMIECVTNSENVNLISQKMEGGGHKTYNEMKLNETNVYRLFVKMLSVNIEISSFESLILLVNC